MTMKHEVTYTRAAAKRLQKMPRNTAEKIRAKVLEVAQNPAGGRNVKALAGAQAGYRLRVGEWRVLFDLVEGTPRVLAVLDIDTRGGVYKG